jgi:hypothetical protein
MKTNWLDRRIAHPGPHLTLCLTEKEYLDAMWNLRIKNPPDWIRTPQADATVHYISNPKQELCCVVCMRDTTSRAPLEVAGLLVHEAVHIWQEYAASIGETQPGREQEAYAVQSIAQVLMEEFARRVA